MGVIAVPLAADRLADWEQWTAELAGPRRAEFDDMNSRHGLTAHEAWLQPTPDGNYLVIAIQDGPGGDGFLPAVMSSDVAFDQWFAGAIADLHGLDPSGPPPPQVTRRL